MTNDNSQNYAVVNHSEKSYPPAAEANDDDAETEPVVAAAGLTGVNSLPVIGCL